MSAALAAALGYARHGWPCFVLSHTKIPIRNCDHCAAEHTTPAQMDNCTCLTCHGFHAATTDPGRLRAMVERHPSGLLAIRTGAASGTVVVDVDPPAGLPTLARLDEAEVLPGTVMQMTGRDGGFQLLYRHPGVRITSRPGALGPGVDVKADDAYVVVPPSVHPGTGRAYRWSGDGRYSHPLTPLHPLLVERLQARPAPVRPRGPQGFAAGMPRGRLRGLVETVLTAPDGQRNAVLYWAACRAADMVIAGEIDDYTAADALTTAAEGAGLGSSEARRTIDSGLRRSAA